MMKRSTAMLSFLSILSSAKIVESFHPIFPRLLDGASSTQHKISNVGQSKKYSKQKCNKIIQKLHPLQSKSDEESEDERTGMDKAFKSLDELSSLDFGAGDVSEANNYNRDKVSTTNIKADIDLLKDLDTNIDSENTSDDEIKLYKDMMQELETEGEDGVYDNIMGEMSTTTGDDSKSNRVINDADGIGSLVNKEEEILTAVEISQDTDKFMKIALEEAMKEVSVKTSDNTIDDEVVSLQDSILNDEELMKEINAVFDRANEKLLDGIDEMKKEQAKLTEASAKSRADSLKSEEQRLAEAEGSVSRLLNKVKEETDEVEKAMMDLQKAQQALLDDPLMKAADMRSGGLVKQAALAGSLLFTFRSLGELFLMTGPNGADHGVAAAIQGALAILFVSLFLFL